MPRRHVSTITGYKVVISCVKAGDGWQQESPHKGGKSRQKWEKISSKLKVCTCSFLLRPCIREKGCQFGKKKSLSGASDVIYFCVFMDRWPFSSARIVGVPSSRVSLMTSLIIWVPVFRPQICPTLPMCHYFYNVTFWLRALFFLPEINYYV